MNLITKENYNPSLGNVYISCESEIFYADYLSDSEKRVYFELKNKLNLSIKNGFATSDGVYYIFYSQEELANKLGYSKRTIHTAFKNLSATDKSYSPLIKLDRETTNTYRIFFYELSGTHGTYERKSAKKQSIKVEDTPNEVPNIPAVPVDNSVDNIGIICEQSTPMDILLEQAEMQVKVEQEQFDYANAKFSHGDEKFACADESFACRKKEPRVRTNKKENNNLSINLSNKEHREEMEVRGQRYRNNLSYIKEQISYYDIVSEYGVTGILDEFVLCATEMLTDDSTRINKVDQPRSIIESMLSRLDMFKMLDVIERFHEIADNVKNISGYMKTMLFDVCRNGSARMHNTFKSDEARVHNMGGFNNTSYDYAM